VYNEVEKIIEISYEANYTSVNDDYVDRIHDVYQSAGDGDSTSYLGDEDVVLDKFSIDVDLTLCELCMEVGKEEAKITKLVVDKL
jgi:hypothetical protein